MAKVLIVLDGGFRFSSTGTPAGTPDFTYETLVEALTAAGHQVTKAHRQSDSSADYQSFNFATTLNLLDFDVLWLIGNRGRNVGGTTTKLPDAELKAIAEFMNAGGGVFATGDHDSIGADMCGHILRVRAMRSWFGAGDPASPMPPDFPRNFPPFNIDSLGQDRAETGRLNPASDYDLDDDGTNESFVWFENQSDSVPQPITPLEPVHPILKRSDGTTIEVFPDHMHEGQTFGEVASYNYETASATFDGETFVEFPLVAGERPLPQVIATGQSVSAASRAAASGSSFVDAHVATPKTINVLSVYDGRMAGVGRIVTGSTFHHYVDINLTGDSRIDTPAEVALVGPDAQKGHGFNDNPAVMADIKQVFVNITNWLARPRPRIQLILERSTFSQAEAQASSDFPGAILVTVDGLKPSQFPGGGITTLSPGPAQLASWAPQLTAQEPAGITFTPTGIASDDPALADRIQRITFTYRVSIDAAAAFGFAGDFDHITVDAALGLPGAPSPLTDSAQITLTKSANPFMLDLANGNQISWLSSDVRVFRVIAGAPGSPLPENATRQQALDYLSSLLSGMTVAQFEALPMGQAESALSPLPLIGDPPRRVYNFAVARVRLPASGASANDVRVFFRVFTSQTTAAVTYLESPPGTPIQGYKKTPGPAPIALPGTNAANTEWLSFPMFAAPRAATPESQTDPSNVKSINPGESVFFGCLVDNNLTDPYLPQTPGGGGALQSLPTLTMGEHQCIVAQIEFSGTPIPSGANPAKSDKLAQRNIAFSTVANPGLDASRQAFHTFEIEAAPHAVSEALPPDELMLEWRGGAPGGTEVRVFIPDWDAAQVVALADRFYPRHEIRALDAHTIALPGGGTRFVPLPPSQHRRTGIISAHLPLGIKKGQRFDLAVRQITNRRRRAAIEPPKVRRISREEAARLLAQVAVPRADGNADAKELPRGAFEVGKNQLLVTDLRLYDGEGDQPILIEYPDPEKVAEIRRREEKQWREMVGAFQLAVPVSVKEEMLPYYVRLLSLLRWRAEHLRPTSRWHATFVRYVEMMADKVRALGGNPDLVPATPDGDVKLPGGAGRGDGADGSGAPGDGSAAPGNGGGFFEPGADDWLGETNGLPDVERARPGMWSGKISGLLFDHFGDFEGFTLEAYDGSHHRFFSREKAILELTEAAWRERRVVTVITVSAQSRRVRRLLIRGYP